MAMETPTFVYEFTPGTIHYGRGCVGDLGSTLADYGLDRALVVCGSNVGSTPDVMEPIESGIGDSLVGVFAETTPDKEIETAHDGAERMIEEDVDVLVAVGGGSSLDVATVMTALAADYRSIDEIRREIGRTGYISAPADRDLVTPLIAVPTTLAGADLSAVGGIMVPVNGGRVGVKATGEALRPAAGFYDPDLFATTPTDVLTGSAMNGFDKGIEALYSRDANPLTDAVAIRGLRYMQSGLPRLVDTDDASVIEEVVVGTVLVQYGCSVGTSIVHSYGHGLRRSFGVQQGIAHAVMVPHALGLLFDRVDGRREVLADALLGTERPADPATAVIDRVTEIRDAMDLPSRLRDLDGVSEEKLRHVAKLTHNDPNMENTPRGFDPTVDDLETVLCDAW